jgi:hypothetical protein
VVVKRWRDGEIIACRLDLVEVDGRDLERIKLSAIVSIHITSRVVVDGSN